MNPIFELVLEGEMVEAMKAGQFLHLRVPDDAHLLRRPISISSIDKATKRCKLIYRVEGAGTAIFSSFTLIKYPFRKSFSTSCLLSFKAVCRSSRSAAASKMLKSKRKKSGRVGKHRLIILL